LDEIVSTAFLSIKSDLKKKRKIKDKEEENSFYEREKREKKKGKISEKSLSKKPKTWLNSSSVPCSPKSTR